MKLSRKSRDGNRTLAKKRSKKDKSIKILKADKGNATVLMNAKEYEMKIEELLNDQDEYALLKSDPTRTTERAC